MIEYDLDMDENCLVALYDSGRIFYTIVQRDPELKHTGLSIIKRIMKDRHQFIGDFYATQSYFMVKYIDDEYIKVDENYGGSDRNEMTLIELDEYITDTNVYPFIYLYSVDEDMLVIKEPEKPLYHLYFHNREEVEEFIQGL